MCAQCAVGLGRGGGGDGKASPWEAKPQECVKTGAIEDKGPGLGHSSSLPRSVHPSDFSSGIPLMLWWFYRDPSYVFGFCTLNAELSFLVGTFQIMWPLFLDRPAARNPSFPVLLPWAVQHQSAHDLLACNKPEQPSFSPPPSGPHPGCSFLERRSPSPEGAHQSPEAPQP